MYARRSEEIVGISQSTRLFAKIIFDPMAGIFSPTGSVSRRRVLLESGSERWAGFVKMMRGPLIVEIRRFSLLVSDKNVEGKICLFRLL